MTDISNHRLGKEAMQMQGDAIVLGAMYPWWGLGLQALINNTSLNQILETPTLQNYYDGSGDQN